MSSKKKGKVELIKEETAVGDQRFLQEVMSENFLQEVMSKNKINALKGSIDYKEFKTAEALFSLLENNTENGVDKSSEIFNVKGFSPEINREGIKQFRDVHLADLIISPFGVTSYTFGFKTTEAKEFFETNLGYFGSLIQLLGVTVYHLQDIKAKENLAKREKDLAKREKALLEKEKKTGKFKRSGHLTDQMLKYNYPPDNKKQLSIFDRLENEETIEKIKGSGVEVTEIVEGIKLSPSETKVIDILCKLLHENSQNSKPENDNYYTGNQSHEVVSYGGDKSTPAPKLAFTLYELTKEYKGGDNVGGKDIENVKQILTQLNNKKFLLSYVETTKIKGGGRIERKIEEFRQLISIVKISETLINKEDIELSKIEETVIVLNPIFRRHINSHFIEYPNDINRRTIIAYGSHNLSEITLKLRDYLIRELNSNRHTPEIYLDKLYYMLAEKWMKESRKKKVKEYLDKALDTVKALGLLEKYEIVEGAKGEPKVIFTLKKSWE